MSNVLTLLASFLETPRNFELRNPQCQEHSGPSDPHMRLNELLKFWPLFLHLEEMGLDKTADREGVGFGAKKEEARESLVKVI